MLLMPQTFDVCLEHTTLSVFNAPKPSKAPKKNQDDINRCQRSKLLQSSPTSSHNFTTDDLALKQHTCTNSFMISLQEMFVLFVVSCLCIAIWRTNQKFSIAQAMNIGILIMACHSQTSTVIRYILCTCTVVSVSLTPEILSGDRISVLTLFVFILYDVCVFLRHHKQNLLMTSLAAFCVTTSICAVVCSYIFVDSTLGIVLDSCMIMAAFILSVPNVY